MLAVPSINHNNTLIFNPILQTINPNFIPTNIYYQDESKKGGKIVEIMKGEDWRIKVILYMDIYKKIGYITYI